MNRIAGAILMLAAAVSGHAVLAFLATNKQFYKYDISPSVSRLVLFAVATATVLGLWGIVLLFKQDPR
jgi:hypothetical protein